MQQGRLGRIVNTAIGGWIESVINRGYRNLLQPESRTEVWHERADASSL